LTIKSHKIYGTVYTYMHFMIQQSFKYFLRNSYEIRCTSIGGRAFVVSATSAWNSISDSTRSAPSLNTLSSGSYN